MMRRFSHFSCTTFQEMNESGRRHGPKQGILVKYRVRTRDEFSGASKKCRAHDHHAWFILHSNWFTCESSEFWNIHRGISILLKWYRCSTHQFELKIMAASVTLPQERKSFHLFLPKYLKIELFLLQWILLYFLLKSTSSFLEFYTVETRSLYLMYSSGVWSPKWKARAIIRVRLA